MPETLVRRVLLKVAGDDADAEAKIDAISAKADELAAKHPELKVRINTAAASVKVAVLRQELRDLAETEARAQDMTFTAGDMQALNTITDLRARVDELAARSATVKLKADDKAARAELLRFQVKADELSRKVIDPKFELRGVLKAQAELAALDAEMDRIARKNAGGPGLLSRLFSGSFGGGFRNGFAALVPGLSGGGGSVAAAGGEGGTSLLGAGAGGLTALPLIAGAIGSVVTEAGALVTGLSAAGLGVGGFAALALPAFSKVHGAMTQIQADQQAYDRALTSKQRQTAMAHLKQDWASMDPAERGAVKGVQQLTGEFAKMSKAFEPTAFKVFGEVLKIANQLLPYVGQFAQAAAPAIEQVLSGLSEAVGGDGFKGFMRFMESLSGPVIKAVGSGMAGLGKDVVRLMESFSKKDVVNSVNIAFRLMGAGLEIVIGIVKGSMHAWDQITMAVHETAHGFDVARHAVASFAHGVAHDFDVLRHATAEFGHDWAHYFDTARHDTASFAHGVAHDWDNVRHAAAELGHDIAVWFGRIRHDIARWAGDVRHDADRVVGWFRALPGRIVSVLAGLPGMLFRAGEHAIGSLVSGLRSVPVVGTVAGIVGQIADHFPHSPAKKGPLSGAGDPLVSGRVIGQRLAQGIESSRPQVSAAMSRALGTGTVTAARPGVAVTGAAAAQQPKVVIQIVGGDREFRIWLKKTIRVTGGNVQVVGA